MRAFLQERDYKPVSFLHKKGHLIRLGSYQQVIHRQKGLKNAKAKIIGNSFERGKEKNKYAGYKKEDSRAKRKIKGA